MVARMAKRKSWLSNMRLTLDTYPGQPAAANEPDDAATSLPPDSGANVHLIDTNVAFSRVSARITPICRRPDWRPSATDRA